MNDILRFQDFAIKDDRLYFYGFGMGGLYDFDIKRKKTRFLSDLNSYGNIEEYRAIAIINNEVFLAPVFGKNIAVYNLINGICKNITIETAEQKGEYSSLKYLSMYQINDKLVLIPTAYFPLAELDTGSKKLTFITDFTEFVRKEITNYQNVRFGASCKVGNSIFIPCKDTNLIIKYDINHLIDKVSIENGFSGYQSVISLDGAMYVISANGDKLGKIDWNSKKMTDVFLMTEGSLFNYLFEMKGKIMAVPFSSDQAEYLYIDKNRIMRKHFFGSQIAYKSPVFQNNSAFLGVKKYRNMLMAYSMPLESLCFFNDEMKLIFSSKLMLETYDEAFESFKCQREYLALSNDNALLVESDDFACNRFVRAVSYL